MRTLFVGDPHFKYTQKDEMERLMGFVLQVAEDKSIDSIIILGDLNDTFNILRTDNLVFWNKWLSKLSETYKLYVLTGNHDFKNQSDDNDLENSLSIFNLIDSPNLFIIQSPVTIGFFGFVPYIHNKNKFVEESNKLKESGAKVLVCHSEFDGAAYDNGFFIKDGVKPEELFYDLVISGHIHTRAAIGKIRYPGAPRWLSSSDANKEKGLWCVDFSENGKILSEEFIDTSKVCIPIYSYQYKEGDNYPEFPDSSRVSVELVGSSEWISKEKARFKGKASVSCKITDKTKSSNRKTGNNFEYFLNNVFEPIKGLKKEKMLEFMKDLGIL